MRRSTGGLAVFVASLAAFGALVAAPAPSGAIGGVGGGSPHTHGPDPKDLDSRGRVEAAAPYAVDAKPAWSASQYDGQAFATDQPDLTAEPTFHALYVYPSDRAGRFAQFAAMFQADAAQASQRLAGLYGRGLRFDYRAGGYLDITVVRSAKTNSKLSVNTQFDVVKNELASRGLLNDPNKKYVVWLDAGSNYCGQGELYPDTRRTSDNSNQRSTLSIVYRPYSSGSADGGFCRGRTLAHELGHNMGALQRQAPNAFDGAHCDDSAEDVMCYPSKTRNDTGGEAFDYRNDDYWDPAANPRSGSAATLPWWTVNLSKYVCATTGCGGAAPSPTNQPPVAGFTPSCTGLVCTFTDQSIDPDGAVTGWSWDFGDGTTSTVRNPSKAYAVAGTYTVTLTATDGTASSSASAPVTVVDSGSMTLTATGYLRSGGYHTVDLAWSGATTAGVDLYRNGTMFKTTENDGFLTNNLSRTGSMAYVYKVCEAGRTRCSPEVIVAF